MKRNTIIGKDINKAATFLREGELVAIPTETVYGLAGNALSRSSVVKIFEAKQRPQFDPLIVHTHSASEVEKYADVTPQILKWIEKLSPGPITYILPKKDVIPDLVTSGHKTVGIRIPRHKQTLKLLRELEFPLAAPSANPFGYVSPTQASHVLDQLNGKLPYILDGGKASVGIESTIIDLSAEEPTVLRLGGFELSELEEAMGIKLTNIKLSSSQPNAPGMLHSHYAPKVKLVKGSVSEVREQYPNAKLGALRYTEYTHLIPTEDQLLLSANGDLNEAAQKLFQRLRQLDSTDWEVVAVEFVPDYGLGKAINDRLTRATHQP
ncbi:L-threonylcarbamoyladenylate synthase [Phaeocystidibacter luteus]|uniref:Threonylcarbamoyl-AMP synthase n=1 Tax=Phaeocystidibacter luteus TaxID=911197 RepID=A0A6N6RDG5_9FLAO|nr:L-threonylcarbamoyladenylate synthase [Phaeocystidibacter luteus]KAB2807327.1 threonylcarbamoyl-AMP synthase [Phaeocystidibacter luteus]